MIRPNQSIRRILAARYFQQFDSAVGLERLIPDNSGVVAKRTIAARAVAIKDADRFLGAACDSVIDLPLPQARVGILEVLRRHRPSKAHRPGFDRAALDNLDLHIASSALDWSRTDHQLRQLHPAISKLRAPRSSVNIVQ